MTQQEFLDRYEYDPQTDRIGGGGFGVVYKAHDKLRKRWVAIKEAPVNPQHTFSLKREVELCNEIEPHPNLLRYENYYRFEVMRTQIDYAVMKFYVVGSLDNLIRAGLTLEQKAELTRGIMQGLSHLHGQDVIHRDLKCPNILIDRDQDGKYVPKICDFGLSRIVGVDAERSSISDSSVGRTIAYAAPEQIKGKGLRKNVDIWALGIIVYKIFTGELPFSAPQEMDFTTAQVEISKKILDEKLPAVLNQIPQPYQNLVRKCLIRNNEVRPQSVAELFAILDTVPESPQNNPTAVPLNPVDEGTRIISLDKPEKQNPPAVKEEETIIHRQSPPPPRSEPPKKEQKPIERERSKETVLPVPPNPQADSPKADKNGRTKLFLGVGGGVLLLVLIGVFWVINHKQTDDKQQKTNPEQPASVLPSKSSDSLAKFEELRKKDVLAAPGSERITLKDSRGHEAYYVGDKTGSKANGLGKAVYLEGGDIHIGYYRDNKKHGYGEYVAVEQKCSFKGNWADDKPSGWGVFETQNPNLLPVKGTMKIEGVFNDFDSGNGKFFDKNGKVLYDGDFKAYMKTEDYNKTKQLKK